MSSFLTDPDFEQKRTFLTDPNWVEPPPVRWCTCTRTGGGFRHAGAGLWVHATCGKPTKMFLDNYEAKLKGDQQ